MHELNSHDTTCSIILCILLLLSSSYASAQCTSSNTVLLPLDAAGHASISISDFFPQPLTLIDSALSQENFDCRDIGIHEILIEGITASEEFFACKELVVVYDSTSNCSDVIQVPKAILGKILTQEGVPVQNVSISLISSDLSIFKNTNEDGIFLFNDLANDTYLIEPNKKMDYGNGVTTQDLLIVQKHLLDLKRITSPYQLIAADINNSKTITAWDMILIRQIILRAIDEFPDNASWRFVKADHEFSDPSNPFDEVLPVSYEVDYLPVISINNNFTAIKVGDLNNSVIANQNQVSKSRSTPTPFFQLSNKRFQEGEVFTVHINTTQNFEATGFQIAFELEGTVLSLEGIQGIAEEAYSNIGDIIRVSHTNLSNPQYSKQQSILQLTFRAKKQGNLIDHFRLEQSSFINEWYDSTLQQYPLGLHFVQTPNLAVSSNYPNPFTHTTLLPISVPYQGLLYLSVYNLRGNEIWSTQKEVAAGLYEVPITAPFPNSGLYLYRLKFGDENILGKLNYIE